MWYNIVFINLYYLIVYVYILKEFKERGHINCFNNDIGLNIDPNFFWGGGIDCEWIADYKI